MFHKCPWTETNDQNRAIGCDHPAQLTSKKIQYVNLYSRSPPLPISMFEISVNVEFAQMSFLRGKPSVECAGGG